MTVSTPMEWQELFNVHQSAGYRNNCRPFDSHSEKLWGVQEILKHLGQRIRELRIQRGFSSQEKFADHCGVHRTFMGHLETGRKDFRVTTVIRVAEALGVTLSELFAGVESGDSVSTGLLPPSRIARGDPMDRRRVLKEVAALEQTVRTLKEIAKAQGDRPTAAVGKPVRHRRKTGSKT